jgi:ATP-binding cassette subfamily F protein uup
MQRQDTSKVQQSDKQAVKNELNQKPKSTNINKLSFKDQYELDNLPKEIDKLEVKIDELNKQIGDVDFYQSDAHIVKQVTQKHKELSEQLQQKYSRWDELES